MDSNNSRYMLSTSWQQEPLSNFMDSPSHAMPSASIESRALASTTPVNTTQPYPSSQWAGTTPYHSQQIQHGTGPHTFASQAGVPVFSNALAPSTPSCQPEVAYHYSQGYYLPQQAFYHAPGLMTPGNHLSTGPTPLQSASSSVLNHAGLGPTTPQENSTRTASKRKRTTTNAANKRRRRELDADLENILPSSICGVGPSSSLQRSTTQTGDASSTTADSETQAVQSEPHSNTEHINNPSESSSSCKAHRKQTKASATDVWYFIRALETDKVPIEKPTNEPIIQSRPSTPYVGCKLCTDRWMTWKHGPGMTSCYRLHMINTHPDIYYPTIKIKNLKNSSEKSGEPERTTAAAPFTKEKFHFLLMKWIVADDQSINVVECPEFRELMFYLADGKIDEADIPHRTAVTKLILETHKLEMEQTRKELSCTEGRISFTTDLWSDPCLNSFMAITAHFMIRGEGQNIEYRTGLLAFRYVEGSHTGVNLAAHFFKVLDEFKITEKIGLITMDNASNNNTLMEELEAILAERGIPFDKDGNRIRCFPHVVNIACQTIIAELKKDESDIGYNFNAPPSATDQPHWESYRDTLSLDPIGRCRGLVAASRVSGQRRLAFKKLLEEGNRKEYWKDKLPDGKVELKVLQLLRDCETRWSSTFNMVDRVLYLFPALQFFTVDQPELDQHRFTITERTVLQDIHQILEVPHRAQELLSGEHTPTLSLSLPTYETLIEQWKFMKGTIPELQHYIDVGISKLEEYLGRARKTRIYAHAMVLNPSMKFTWIRENGSEEDYHNARKWVAESMLKYRQQIRKTSQSTPLPSTHRESVSITLNYGSSSASVTARASANVAIGHARLLGLDPTIRRSQTLSSLSRESSATSLPSSPGPSAPPCNSRIQTLEEIAAENAERERQERLEDDRLVELELKRYEEAGLVFSAGTKMVNMVSFWNGSEFDYPLLFRVAMDTLPAQASAVSCERVFSSSKETCTLRRNRTSQELLEALQFLKFRFRAERLNFVHDLIAKVEDYSISGPLTENAVDELMASGKVDELRELINNSREEL